MPQARARLLLLLLSCSIIVPRAAAIRCCTEDVYFQSGCGMLGGFSFEPNEVSNLTRFDDPVQCATMGDIYKYMGGSNWNGPIYDYYQRAATAAATGPGYYVGYFSYIVCNGDFDDLGGRNTFRDICEVLTSLGEVSGGAPVAGRIPDSIGNLNGLVDFNFPGNPSLSGTLPASIGSLTALTSLILDDCSLTGTLPPSLGSLTNLKRLQLRGNSFTGAVPDLSALTALTFLDLSYNSFSGSVPSSITALPLLALHLEGNAFTGPIDFLTGLTVATYVNLFSNQFSGSVPPLTAAVQYLFAHENFLTGGLPDLSKTFTVTDDGETTTTTTALRTLDLCKNMLSATITDDQWDQMTVWVKMHKTTGFWASGLDWTWQPGPDQLPVPEFDSVVYFDISNNALQGTIPRENSIRSLVNVLPQRGFNLLMQYTLIADFSEFDRSTDDGISFTEDHDDQTFPNFGQEETLFGLLHWSLSEFPPIIVLRADAPNCAETLPASLDMYGQYAPYTPFFPADAAMNLAPHGHLHYSGAAGLTGTSLTIIGDCPGSQCVLSAAAVRHFTLFHAGLKLVRAARACPCQPVPPSQRSSTLTQHACFARARLTSRCAAAARPRMQPAGMRTTSTCRCRGLPATLTAWQQLTTCGSCKAPTAAARSSQIAGAFWSWTAARSKIMKASLGARCAACLLHQLPARSGHAHADRVHTSVCRLRAQAAPSSARTAILARWSSRTRCSPATSRPLRPRRSMRRQHRAHPAAAPCTASATCASKIAPSHQTRRMATERPSWPVRTPVSWTRSSRRTRLVETLARLRCWAAPPRSRPSQAPLPQLTRLSCSRPRTRWPAPSRRASFPETQLAPTVRVARCKSRSTPARLRRPSPPSAPAASPTTRLACPEAHWRAMA
jgi:hypothetical protein